MLLTFIVAFLLALALLLTVLCRSGTDLHHTVAPPWSRALLHACVAVVACWMGCLAEERMSSDVLLDLSASGEKVRIVGTIISEPERLFSRKDGSGKWRFRMRTDRVRPGLNEWVELNTVLPVVWYGPSELSPPDYGWFVICDGRLHAASSRNHSAGEAVLHTGLSGCRPLSGGHGNWFKSRCIAMRRGASRILSTGIDDSPRAAGVIKALLLGYRFQLDSDIKTVFVNTGTLHVFAISGLHVGIMALLIISVLRSLRVSRVYWGLALIPLLLAYTLATGAKPSAVRACIMAGIYFSAPLFGRKGDSLSSVAMAALAILMISPRDLQDVGFVLSFSVVTGIIVLYPVLSRELGVLLRCGVSLLCERRIDSDNESLLLDGDPWAPESRSPGRSILRWTAKYLSSLVVLSVCAWLVSAPLSAYFFGRFSPVALLANLLAIPLTFLVVLTGCLSLITGCCFAVLAEVFNCANLALVSCLVRSTTIASAIPLGTYELPNPPLWTVLLWYMVLALMVAWYRERAEEAIPIPSN